MSKKKQDGDSLIQAIIEMHNLLLVMRRNSRIYPKELAVMLISSLKSRGNVDSSRLCSPSKQRAFIKSALSGFVEAMREGVASGAYSGVIEDVVLQDFAFIQSGILEISKSTPMSVQQARLACNQIYYTCVIQPWLTGETSL